MGNPAGYVYLVEMLWHNQTGAPGFTVRKIGALNVAKGMQVYLRASASSPSSVPPIRVSGRVTKKEGSNNKLITSCSEVVEDVVMTCEVLALNLLQPKAFTRTCRCLSEWQGEYAPSGEGEEEHLVSR